jgi:hypothetical protein
MKLDDLARELPALREEAKKWHKTADEARARAQGLDQIIRGIERATGLSAASPQRQQEAERESPPEPQDGAQPSSDGALVGIAAVRRVMMEQPDKIWRARDVHEELERRGWVSDRASHPLRGTEAAINRLWRRGQIERVRTGRYRVTEVMRQNGD